MEEAEEEDGEQDCGLLLQSFRVCLASVIQRIDALVLLTVSLLTFPGSDLISLSRLSRISSESNITIMIFFAFLLDGLNN